MQRLVLASTIMLGVWAGESFGGLITNFDAGSTDLTGNFAANGQTLPNWASTIGIGGSGGVDVSASNFGNFQAVQIGGTSEDFGTAGAKLVVSAYLRIDAAPTNNPTDARILDLYLTEDTATNVSGTGAGNAHVGIRLTTVTNNTTYRMQIRNNNATGTSDSSFTGLVLGNWYKFSVEFTNESNLAAGQIGLNASLVDYGTSGTVAGSTLDTFATTVTNLTLTGDSTAYSAFRIPRGDNLSALDNFSYGLVPEPASFALAGLVAPALLRRRR